MEKLRNLDELCLEALGTGFCKIILDEAYCGLRTTKPGVYCPYRMLKPDHNGMYVCNNALNQLIAHGDGGFVVEKK